MFHVILSWSFPHDSVLHCSFFIFFFIHVYYYYLPIDEVKFDISELQMNENSSWMSNFEQTSANNQNSLFNVSGLKRPNSFMGFTPG